MRRESTVGTAGEETGVICLYRGSAQSEKRVWIRSGEEYELTAEGRLVCMVLGCLEEVLVLLLLGLEFRAEYLAVYGLLGFSFAVLSKAALTSAVQMTAYASAVWQRIFGHTVQKYRGEQPCSGRKHLVNPASRCYTWCRDGREWSTGRMRRAG